MKASAKRAISLIMSGALLIASLVIYAVLIRPEYDLVQQLRGTLVSKTNLLNEEQTMVEQVGNLIAQYQNVAKLEDSLNLSLPPDEALSSLMAQINAIAGFSGLAIQSADIGYLPERLSSLRIPSAKKLGALRINLKLTGNYSSLKQFLQNLEANIRIMDAVGLKIDPAGKIGQDLFTYAITIDTYYQTK